MATTIPRLTVMFDVFLQSVYRSKEKQGLGIVVQLERDEREMSDINAIIPSKKSVI